MLNQFLSVFLQTIIHLKLILILFIQLMNKCKKTLVFKFLLILAITITLSGNAQNNSTYSKNVLSTKDSSITEKNIGQIPIDSTVLKSKPAFNKKI